MLRGNSTIFAAPEMACKVTPGVDLIAAIEWTLAELSRPVTHEGPRVVRVKAGFSFSTKSQAARSARAFAAAVVGQEGVRLGPMARWRASDSLTVNGVSTENTVVDSNLVLKRR